MRIERNHGRLSCGSVVEFHQKERRKKKIQEWVKNICRIIQWKFQRKFKNKKLKKKKARMNCQKKQKDPSWKVIYSNKKKSIQIPKKNLFLWKKWIAKSNFLGYDEFRISLDFIGFQDLHILQSQIPFNHFR